MSSTFSGVLYNPTLLDHLVVPVWLLVFLAYIGWSLGCLTLSPPALRNPFEYAATTPAVDVATVLPIVSARKPSAGPTEPPLRNVNRYEPTTRRAVPSFAKCPKYVEPAHRFRMSEKESEAGAKACLAGLEQRRLRHKIGNEARTANVKQFTADMKAEIERDTPAPPPPPPTWSEQQAREFTKTFQPGPRRCCDGPWCGWPIPVPSVESVLQFMAKTAVPPPAPLQQPNGVGATTAPVVNPPPVFVPSVAPPVVAAGPPAPRQTINSGATAPSAFLAPPISSQRDVRPARRRVPAPLQQPISNAATAPTVPTAPPSSSRGVQRPTTSAAPPPPTALLPSTQNAASTPTAASTSGSGTLTASDLYACKSKAALDILLQSEVDKIWVWQGGYDKYDDKAAWWRSTYATTDTGLARQDQIKEIDRILNAIIKWGTTAAGTVDSTKLPVKEREALSLRGGRMQRLARNFAFGATVVSGNVDFADAKQAVDTARQVFA